MGGRKGGGRDVRGKPRNPLPLDTIRVGCLPPFLSSRLLALHSPGRRGGLSTSFLEAIDLSKLPCAPESLPGGGFEFDEARRKKMRPLTSPLLCATRLLIPPSPPPSRLLSTFMLSAFRSPSPLSPFLHTFLHTSWPVPGPNLPSRGQPARNVFRVTDPRPAGGAA